ncbi:hypothetical protein CR513_44796, partial [Mucuna pruriens]
MSTLVSLDVTNQSSHLPSSISKDLPNLRSLWIECDSKLQLSQNTTMSECGDYLLPDDNYLDWLTFNNEGSSVIFEIPQISAQVESNGDIKQKQKKKKN